MKKVVLAAGLLLGLHTMTHAQSDWKYINPADIVNSDTITKKGYTLVFINMQPGFSEDISKQLINRYFEVYPAEAKVYNKKTMKTVTFIIDPKYTAVAAASDGIIRFNPKWFDRSPNDIDVVTHEVMHVVQSYPGDAGPGWLTEGIADYVRATIGKSNEAANWRLPNFDAQQHYTNAYRVTARFLLWIEKKVKKGVVVKMDAALRSAKYNDGLWKEYTGKTVDELWSAYAANPTI
ncbi:basic secretory peptidase family protein [Chitinophaga skermanii]|uniref:Basic secretory peptidase family protein n=1 Tax=Chitinophaga skermanii TaxID=331697 RepID=A0A327QXL9_9BACT|nr:basic secretory protein-like protein [Chitinophaga skermanii]RAJ08538.1 basic secretory peptidase family protein [Chitinophaga skermanii]